MSDGKMPSEVLEKFKAKREENKAPSGDEAKMKKRQDAKKKSKKFKKDKS